MICYKITNLINNKVYIGITKCALSKRWNEHKCKSKNPNTHIGYAISKYGIENFKIEIIKTFENEHDMYNYEIEQISFYKSNMRKYGYNNSIGGERSRKGSKMSNQAKENISKYQKTRKRNCHSYETKQKMSQKAKGRDMSLAVKISALKRRGKPATNRVSVSLNDTTIYQSITDASKQTGVSITSISNNIKGLSKTTKVGVWKKYTVQN